MLIILRALRVKRRRANTPYFFQFFIYNREALFGSVLKFLSEFSSHVEVLLTLKAGVSWCCGNYCLLAFVLWCGYCSVSFQSFVLRHWCPQHQETTLKANWFDTLTVKQCEIMINIDVLLFSVH